MSLENRTLLNRAVGKPRLRIAAGSPIKTEQEAEEAAARLKQAGWYDFTLRRQEWLIKGVIIVRWYVEAAHTRIRGKVPFVLMPSRDASPSASMADTTPPQTTPSDPSRYGELRITNGPDYTPKPGS